MSENASPAGPATEPVGQPAAQPDGPDPNKTIQETSPDDGEGTRQAARKRPSLPGLVSGSNDAPDPELSKAIGEEDRKAKAPQRDPATGRFKSADDEREAELLAEREPAARPDLPEGEEPEAAETKEKGQKFKFAGADWDSQEAAEQNFRSLRGVHKSLLTRAQAEEQEKLYGYRAANAWQAETERRDARIGALEQELASYKSGSGPSKTPSGEPAGDDLTELLETFTYIANNGTVAQAGEFLLTEAAKLAEGRNQKRIEELEAKLNQKLLPYETDREQYQIAENMTQITQQVAEYRLQDGTLAFPELRSSEKLERIGEIWGEQGLPEETLRTPQGIITAIGLMRLYDGLPAAALAPSPSPAPAKRVAPGAAALSATDSRGLPERDRSTAGLPPHLAKLSRELGKPDSMIDKRLGFTRNPRV